MRKDRLDNYKKIEELVYIPYNITSEERKIIEGKN